MTQPTQADFFSVVCNRTKPPPATVDADFIGIDDASTERYLCKGQRRQPHLPASEWICSHLARACGLPVPPFAAIELANDPGVYYFGSQWQGGSIDPAVAFPLVSNPDIFARTHAADLFLHNLDRHLGNWLYLDLDGDVVARVIDFSQAWLINGWPLPDLPLPAASKTMVCLPVWMGQHRANYVRPEAILDKVASLPVTWMLETLAGMPDAWLDAAERLKLRHWWISEARTTRVESAKANLP